MKKTVTNKLLEVLQKGFSVTDLSLGKSFSNLEIDEDLKDKILFMLENLEEDGQVPKALLKATVGRAGCFNKKGPTEARRIVDVFTYLYILSKFFEIQDETEKEIEGIGKKPVEVLTDIAREEMKKTDPEKVQISPTP